jgi:hypothetical protein
VQTSLCPTLDIDKYRIIFPPGGTPGPIDTFVLKAENSSILQGCGSAP